jgi:hypothetical protein
VGAAEGEGQVEEAGEVLDGGEACFWRNGMGVFAAMISLHLHFSCFLCLDAV